MIEANPVRLPSLQAKAAFLNQHEWRRKQFEDAHTTPTQVSVANVLLGSRDADTVDFYQTKRPGGGTGDSMYRENSNYYSAEGNDFEVMQYPMRSLDSLSHEDPLHFAGVDFLKLDVQGAELEVLQGAKDALSEEGTVNFVLLEAPLSGEFNEGAPDLTEYLTFMKAWNFSVIDIFEVHHLEESENELRHPTALQVDLLFARNSRRGFDDKLQLRNIQNKDGRIHGPERALYVFSGRDKYPDGVY